MPLTKVSYSMITGAPINILDFGADPTGSTDSTQAIQNALDVASAASSQAPTNPYLPENVICVQIPAGKYLITDTLTLSNNLNFCSIVGDDNAELYFTGSSGACLHIGNNTSAGVMPVHVKNITIKSPNTTSGTYGLLVEHASNGYYESISIQGFDVGIYNKGSINCLYDFKHRPISGSITGFLNESSQPSGGGLRFASNLVEVKNCHFMGGTKYGFVQTVGAGVTSTTGTGGLVKLSYCTFEGINSTSGRSIYVKNNGEIRKFDQFVIEHCWFENYGNLLAAFEYANVKFQNCFIVGDGKEVIQLLDNVSTIELDSVYSFFDGVAPPSNALVNWASPLTPKAWQVVSKNNYQTSGTSVQLIPWASQITYSDVIQTEKAIVLDSNYPSGNDDYSSNLALDLYVVYTTLFGAVPNDSKLYVDFNLLGTDGSSVGTAAYRLFIQNSAGTNNSETREIVAGVGIVLSGNTITFPPTNARWYKTRMAVSVHNLSNIT